MKNVKAPATADTPFYSDSLSAYTKKRVAHWDSQSGEKTYFGKAYHKLLEGVFRKQIPAGSRVIEIGCGRGELLASLQPSLGVGIDFSAARIKAAQEAYPHLVFIEADAHAMPQFDQPFDYVVLSDLLNDVFDVLEVFKQVRKLCHSGTRVVMTFRSQLWHLPIRAARRLGLAESNLSQNWLAKEDVENMLQLSGFEMVRGWQEMLAPIDAPFVGSLLNRFAVKTWPFTHGALCHFMVARCVQPQSQPAELPSVSVVVPARNEAGHIAEILERVPEMGAGTEIVFVEGGSSDDTYETIVRELESFDRLPARLYQQSGKGKGDATRLGFDEAKNDILMILDADLTVQPEDLPKFYNALVSGSGELINGVRLVYPMEQQAMRFLNLLGNKFFSLAFSYVLGQPIKDTLCGTKVLRKSDWDKLLDNRDYFGDFDPYGDFDIIFGAAKQNLKIVDMPVRYHERRYGETNINRWEGGWLLFRMLLVALRKLKYSAPV